MATIADPKSAVAELLDVAPARVLFWSGAGVSGDAPTLGPLGNSLTDRAISEGFDRELLGCLQRAYSALDLPRNRPRLESVLDVFVAEHGVDALALLLEDLREPPPNANHRFFATHIRHGGGHVTANFDTCIERAGADPAGVVHFHGSLSGPGGVAALGARLSAIERGFDINQREALDRCLAAATVMVVVGYSGLDYFDVDRYWRAAAENGLFVNRRVVWINHGAGWRISTGQVCTRKQLRILADVGGAQVHQIDAPTRDVLNLLAASWGMQPIPTPPSTVRADPRSLNLTPAAKEHATTRFLTAAGLRPTVRDRLSARLLTNEEHGWAADVAWGAGQYRRAADHWVNAYPGDDPTSMMLRQERQAACLWLRGRLRAARRLLLYTLDQAAQQGVDPELRLVTAETLARVLTHMRRLPDTRLLVTQASQSRALTSLDGIEATLLRRAAGRSLPVHLRARLASARTGLTGRPAPAPGDEPRRDFDESEALGAMMNYEHASLRARVEQPSTGDGGPPADWEYWRHQARFQALGDFADAARVPLLPAAAGAFPVMQVIRDLARCDFTGYHLGRLIVLHLLQRARGHRFVLLAGRHRRR